MGDGRIGSEGAWTMERQKIINDLRRLAGSKSNDAVKLAFLDEGQLEKIDGLELGALKEFKRSGNGAVELKLVDRAAVLERLVELSGGREDKAEAFFQALKESADAV